ncbi:MAG TPA: DUF4870 domain-containing protein [Gammaproteobacteria bacterium]|nr:DUF4870 domain-containing protein [Gammaproteobacteria bacterium]
MAETNPPSEPETTATGQQEGSGAPVQITDKGLAALAHALGILLGFLGPLILLFVANKDDEFLQANIKEALNFQLVVLAIWILIWILAFFIIGLFLMPIHILANIGFCIWAAVKANQGQEVRYPFIPRIVK